MGNRTAIPRRNLSCTSSCKVLYTQSTVDEEEEVTHSTRKMDCVVMKCAKCSENFSEDRVPRSLVCGHSLCTPCAEKCLADQNPCPECHEKQTADKVTNLPINFPILRLIRSIASGEVDISDMIVTTIPADIFSSEEEKDIWKCSVHGNPLSFLCCTCSVWVCQDCLVVDHPRLPRGSCKVVGLTDAMEQVKREHANAISCTLREVEEMKRTFEFEIAMHDFCLKHCSNDNRTHGWLTQQIGSQVEDLKKSNDSLVGKAKGRVVKLTDPVNTTTSPQEMTSSCKELLEYQSDLKEDIALEKEKILPVLKIMIDHFRKDLKVLAGGMAPVYAVLDGDEGSKWARIAVVDNTLLLYCLNEGTPSKEGITIPFEYAKKLIPEEDMTVFFEVGTEGGEVIERVFVTLQYYSPLTQQFLLLCSGEKGVSYRNTHFYKYDEKDGLLKGGDYENNDGTGGRPIVKGLGDCDILDVYHRTVGSLVVDTTSTRFHFLLKNREECVEGVVGKVTAGLKKLKTLAKAEPVRKTVIKDCGLFIPMNREDLNVA